jgi:Ran GTPase-activating protein (RanGAP) involved in mRNA processing and transport
LPNELLIAIAALSPGAFGRASNQQFRAVLQSLPKSVDVHSRDAFEAVKSGLFLIVRELDLRGPPTGEIPAIALADLVATSSTLASLDLSFREDPDTVQKVIEALPANGPLTALNLHFTRLDANAAAALAKFLRETRTLKHLDLGRTDMDAPAARVVLDALCANRTLTTLRLGGDQYQYTAWLDGGAMRGIGEMLRRHPALTKIDLNHIDIGPQGVQELAAALLGNCRLRSLRFGGLRLPTGGVRDVAEALRKHPALSSFKLAPSWVSDQDMQAVATLLRENLALRSFSMRNTRLDAAQVQTLADALGENRTLTSLDMAVTTSPYQPDTMLPVVQALRGHPELRNVDLSYNQLSSAVVEAAAILRDCSRIEALNLTGSHIELPAARELAESLAENRTLRSLDLTGCRMGPEALRAVMQSVRRHPTLTRLNVSDNAADASVAQSIAEMLKADKPKGHPTLTSLDLSNNELGNEGVRTVLAALHANRRLADLNLAYNRHELDWTIANDVEALVSENGSLMTLMLNCGKCEKATEARLKALSSSTGRDVAV